MAWYAIKEGDDPVTGNPICYTDSTPYTTEREAELNSDFGAISDEGIVNPPFWGDDEVPY